MAKSRKRDETTLTVPADKRPYLAMGPRHRLADPLHRPATYFRSDFNTVTFGVTATAPPHPTRAKAV